MSSCQFCGAETRPGDKFCLNCGNPLSVPDAPPTAEDATMLGNPFPPRGNPSAAQPDIAPDSTTAHVSSAQEEEYARATVMAAPHSRTVENPGQLLLYAYKGEELQHGTAYELEKIVTTLGRATENDIVLADEDKVISRYHATVRYSDGTYTLIDNGSSNGTSVNGQPLDKQSPRMFQDGDHVTIGDYELVYYAPLSISSEATMIGLSPAPDFATASFGDQQEELDEGGTSNWNWEDHSLPPGSAWQALVPEPAAEPAAEPPPPPSAPAPVGATLAASGMNVQRFLHPVHPLPDIAALLNAVSALNTQVVALQGQLTQANDATESHQTEVTETTQQLQDGLRQVSTQVARLVTEGNESRDAVRWEQLLLLVQDVIRNPRDIDTVRAFAGRANDLNMILQQYDASLQTLAQCNTQLHTLSGENEA